MRTSEYYYEVIHAWYYHWLHYLHSLPRYMLKISGGVDSRFLLSFADPSNTVWWNWKYKYSGFEGVGEIDERLKKKKRQFEETHSWGFDSLGACLATMKGLSEARPEDWSGIVVTGKMGECLGKNEKHRSWEEQLKLYPIEVNEVCPYADVKLYSLFKSEQPLLFHTLIYLLYLDYQFIQFPYKSHTDSPTYSFLQFPYKEAIKMIDGWKLDVREREMYEYNKRRLYESIQCCGGRL